MPRIFSRFLNLVFYRSRVGGISFMEPLTGHRDPDGDLVVFETDRDSGKLTRSQIPFWCENRFVSPKFSIRVLHAVWTQALLEGYHPVAVEVFGTKMTPYDHIHPACDVKDPQPETPVPSKI